MILEVAFFMADETTEKAEKPIDTSVKARYWWAVLYQENMVDGWRDNIEELLQLPYAYWAADAWNRDHAAPQRTYRGRAR